MEAETEELSTKRAALASPTARVNDVRRLTRAADVELGGLTVESVAPIPEARELTRDNTKEGTTVDGVKGVSAVQSNVYPTRVQIKN